MGHARDQLFPALFLFRPAAERIGKRPCHRIKRRKYGSKFVLSVIGKDEIQIAFPDFFRPAAELFQRRHDPAQDEPGQEPAREPDESEKRHGQKDQHPPADMLQPVVRAVRRLVAYVVQIVRHAVHRALPDHQILVVFDQLIRAFLGMIQLMQIFRGRYIREERRERLIPIPVQLAVSFAKEHIILLRIEHLDQRGIIAGIIHVSRCPRIVKNCIIQNIRRPIELIAALDVHMIAALDVDHDAGEHCGDRDQEHQDRREKHHQMRDKKPVPDGHAEFPISPSIFSPIIPASERKTTFPAVLFKIYSIISEKYDHLS